MSKKKKIKSTDAAFKQTPLTPSFDWLGHTSENKDSAKTTQSTPAADPENHTDASLASRVCVKPGRASQTPTLKKKNMLQIQTSGSFVIFMTTLFS